MKRILLVIVITYVLTGPLFSFENNCGNDGDRPPDCNTGGGSNPVNIYQANLWREVEDLRTFGAAPILFKRVYNSRTLTFNSSYWDFGMNEGWQHNWNYEMRQLSSKTFGFFDIKIRYPDGREYNFVAADNTGQQLVPPAHCGDRLYKLPGTPVRYTLVRPDGTEYDFLRYLSPKFDLKEVRDGQGLSWIVTHDANHKVKKITNNFGRWIEIERGLVGTIEVILKVKSDDGREIEYGYTSWAPTSEATLTSVVYPDQTQAQYSWAGANSLTTGRPLLLTADDPMYGGAGARTKYVYNYDFVFDFGSGPYLVTGVIKEERNKLSEKLILSMPGGAGPYPEVLEGNGTAITKKFTSARLTESADGEGRTSSMTYSAGGQGFLLSKTEPNLGTTTYSRDFSGRVLSKTDPNGNVESMVYNGDGFLISGTCKSGEVTTITRNVANQPTRKDHPDGTYEEWTYTPHGLIATYKERLGGTKSYSYDVKGNLLSTIDAEGNTWTYTYDAAGLQTSVTDPLLNTKLYSYNWRGQITTVTYPDDTWIGFEYDTWGNVVEYRDELGNINEYEYNEFNRIVEHRDSLNRATTYEYGMEPGCGSCGFSAKVTKITFPSGKSAEYTYDRSWKLLTEVVAPGTAEEAITEYTYDDAGDLISITNPEQEVMNFAYDVLHRKISQTDSLNRTTEWTYDADGNITEVKKPDNAVTSFEYDEMNRLKKIIEPLGQTIEMTYTGGDRLASLKDARNNIQTFEYDLRNYLTKTTYPGGSYEEYTYDTAGRMEEYRTRSGEIRSYEYDDRDRVVQVDWSDATPSVTRTYDAAGRILTVNNANSDITYTYDSEGQMLSESQDINGLNQVKVTEYEYNQDGLLAKVTYPDGKEFSYTYTDRNLVKDIGFNILTDPLVRYTYDLAGRKVKREMNNNTTSEYTYDELGQTLSIEHSNGAGAIDSRFYAYDLNGRRKWEKRGNGLGDVYSYDMNAQLTGVLYDAQTPDSTPSNALGTENFAYDNAGNRVSVITTGTTTYSTNALNQYTAISGHADPPLYDANGNLASLEDQGFYYNAEGQLVASDDFQTYQLSMFYDGLGRLVARHDNLVWTYYAYSGWNVIEEYDGSGNQTAAIAHGTDVDEYIFRWSSGYNICYYHQDPLGSVVALTDISGVVTESYRYDVYGRPQIFDAYNQPRASSFFGNRYMFTGRIWCKTTRLYEYRNRFYSPTLGRFLQTDPVRLSGGDVNLYRYVGNHPTNARDPYGLTECASLDDVGNMEIIDKDHEPTRPDQTPESKKGEKALRDRLPKPLKDAVRNGEMAATGIMQMYTSIGAPFKLWLILKYKCCECVMVNDEPTAQWSGEKTLQEPAMLQQPGSGSTNGDIWSPNTVGRDMMFINQALSETWSTLESKAKESCK